MTNKKQLREIGLNFIKQLEDSLNYDRFTCYLFLGCNKEIGRDYLSFLKKEKIYNYGSIRSNYFAFDGNEPANLFRMMVITEFFKRMGVEL
jgi:hypothetical protein